MTEIEKPLLTILIDMFMTAPDKRKPDAVAEAQKALPKPFGVLNAALEGREYLLGSTFTVADLNLASILSWSQADQVRLQTVPERRRLARPLPGAAGLQGGEARPSRRYSAGAACGTAMPARGALVRQQQRHRGDHERRGGEAEEQQVEIAGRLAHPGDQQDGERARRRTPPRTSRRSPARDSGSACSARS